MYGLTANMGPNQTPYPNCDCTSMMAYIFFLLSQNSLHPNINNHALSEVWLSISIFELGCCLHPVLCGWQLNEFIQSNVNIYIWWYSSHKIRSWMCNPYTVTHSQTLILISCCTLWYITKKCFINETNPCLVKPQLNFNVGFIKLEPAFPIRRAPSYDWNKPQCRGQGCVVEIVWWYVYNVATYQWAKWHAILKQGCQYSSEIPSDRKFANTYHTDSRLYEVLMRSILLLS